MIIEIDYALYTKVKRDHALHILSEAQLAPDKFTAHRDGTFTAYYLRERQDELAQAAYDRKMEAVDYRVAIYKYPSTGLDRGRYLTLRFAMAAVEQIGVEAAHLHNGNGTGQQMNGTHKSGPAAARKDATGGMAAALARLNGISRDMGQLTRYAIGLADNYHTHKHLNVTLDELQRQITLLNDALAQLQVDAQTSA